MKLEQTNNTLYIDSDLNVDGTITDNNIVYNENVTKVTTTMKTSDNSDNIYQVTTL